MKRGEKNSKKVRVESSEGEIKYYKSAAEAATELKYNVVSLRTYCRKNHIPKWGRLKGWKFEYIQSRKVYQGDEGSRGRPPENIGELMQDLRIFPSKFPLQIDQDVNFDLVTMKGMQQMHIQPAHYLKMLRNEEKEENED